MIRNEIGMTSVGDERGAEVAEQPEQHADDQQRAFSRFSSTVPIVASTSSERSSTGLTVDARRQRLRDLLQPLGHGRGNDAAVPARQHQGGADDDFLAVLRSPSRCAGRRRCCTVATSRTVTGTPPRRGDRRAARSRRACGCGRRRGRERPRRRARRSWRRPRCWRASSASASSEKEMP